MPSSEFWATISSEVPRFWNDIDQFRAKLATKTTNPMRVWPLGGFQPIPLPSDVPCSCSGNSSPRPATMFKTIRRLCVVLDRPPDQLGISACSVSKTPGASAETDQFWTNFGQLRTKVGAHCGHNLVEVDWNFAEFWPCAVESVSKTNKVGFRVCATLG